MKKKFSVAGVTLVEVMVVCVISAVILLALMTVFSSARGVWYGSQAMMDVQDEARRVMEAMSRELREGSSGAAERFVFFDTVAGHHTQGLWMASARGSALAPGEDGSPANDYMHLDANYAASWRSVVIFCPYRTPEGLRQLRRYVDFGTSIDFYAQPNRLPLTFIAASAANLTFERADGSLLIIDRSAGRVMANYLGTEDTNANAILDANENDGGLSLPDDNADGFLDLGFNCAIQSGSITVRLFLTQELSRAGRANRAVIATARRTIAFRQP